MLIVKHQAESLTQRKLSIDLINITAAATYAAQTTTAEQKAKERENYF